MKIGDIIGLISLIIGLPSFFILFFNGQTIIAILTLFLVLIIVVGAWWYKWYSNLPMITQLRVEKVLDILTSDAAEAKLTQTVTARANHKGLTEYWVGNVGSTGFVRNIKIDGKDPDLREEIAGDLRIGKRFSQAKTAGEGFRLVVTLDATDSFPSDPEGLIHHVHHETKQLTIIVNFNSSRPVRRTWVTLRLGGEIVSEGLPKPWVSDDGLRLVYEMKNPKLAGQYFIEWNW